MRWLNAAGWHLKYLYRKSLQFSTAAKPACGRQTSKPTKLNYIKIDIAD